MADNQDEKSSFTEIAMMALCATPVFGAMMSAPVVGSTLIFLSLFDSVMLLLGGRGI